MTAQRKLYNLIDSTLLIVPANILSFTGDHRLERQPNLSRSEVAQLRKRVEEEIRTMHLLMSGPAIVSRHNIIACKHNNLAAYRRELGEMVGDKLAGPLFFEIYHQAVEGDEQCE